MSSLSKSKYPSGFNIHSVAKAKEIGTKIKTVSLNSYVGVFETTKPQGNQIINSDVLINTRSSVSNNTSNKNGINNNPTSNSFRQPIINVVKFKTAKSSPEKYLDEDRNLSEDKSKFLVKNFMKPSGANSQHKNIHNSKQSVETLTALNNEKNYPIEEITVINDMNLLEIVSKKVMKNSDNKQKINPLNSTDPINHPNIMNNLLKDKIHTENLLIEDINDNMHKSNSNYLNTYNSDNKGSVKLNNINTNSKIIQDKIVINSDQKFDATILESKNITPRYSEILQKYSDINQKENNKNEIENDSQKKVANSSSVKKIQNSILGRQSANSILLNKNIKANKFINKFSNNSEKILNNLKKKATPILNEINNPDQPLVRQQTPNIIQNSISKKIPNLKHTNKVSITTPVTSKHSRKNSLEKQPLTNEKKQINVNATGQIAENSNTNIKTNNMLSNIHNNAYKLQTRVGLVANSNNASHNPKMSLHNSFQNLIELSKEEQIINPTVPSQNKKKSDESNLYDDEMKKYSKPIGTNAKSNVQLIEETKSNPNVRLNNLNNNLKLYNVSQANKNNQTPSNQSKISSNQNYAPITNSYAGSKNNSKSASRIEEKPETVRMKIIESEVKNNNNYEIVNDNSKNINIKKTQQNEKINHKKHLTSKNSPSHFPFNFHKENIHTNSQKNNVIDNKNSNKNTIIKQNDKNNSVSKQRDEAVTVKNKPVVSLKLNLNNNMKSHEKESNITTSHHINFKGLTNPNSMAQSKEKIGTNNKNFNLIAGKNSNQNTRRVSVGKLEFKNQKTLIKDAPANTNASLDNELDDSTTSMKSTMRESNYYKREAEKIANYIQQYSMKYNEYPPTSLKFYKFGRLLGRGAFGKVNLCLHTLSGRLVAVKSFNKTKFTSENSKKKILHETNLMKNLKHNSIVKIYEIIESCKYILIVMENVCGGDLLSFVRKRSNLNEITSKFIFRQIIETLQYIHSQKIVHRDIKLDNILIDLNNNIKICDFGISRQVRNEEILHEQCGTPAYIAPEILQNEGYDGYGVDVWSAGVVLYTMLSGTVPFKATKMPDLHQLIIAGKYSPIKDISVEAADLLSGILEVNPKKRLNIHQILNHEWLKSSEEIINDKTKFLSKMNLFTNAERILLSKSNIDYKTAEKEYLIENFTLKNLDTRKESENQNVNTKSYIFAPFNSKNQNNINIFHPELKIENEALKFCGKAKESNRFYELNNNGEIDMGLLIEATNPEVNHNNSIVDGFQSNNLNKGKDIQSVIPTGKISKNVSKPISPPEFIKDGKISDISLPNEEKHRHSRINTKDFSITNANTFVVDEIILKNLENIGYKKDYLLKCLYSNELNYATASYYLLLSSTLD